MSNEYNYRETKCPEGILTFEGFDYGVSPAPVDIYLFNITGKGPEGH